MKRRENIVFGTDFCLNGYRMQRKNYTHTEAPKYYRYAQNINPEEFFLAENLASKPRSVTSLRSRMELPKSTDVGELQKMNMAQQIRPSTKTALQLRTQIETMSESMMSKSVFTVTKVSGYYSSGAAVFDSIRPVFDLRGSIFFPYPVVTNSMKSKCINISNIKFKTEYLEFPFECIDHIDAYIALIRFVNKQKRFVSSIIQVPLKPKKQGVWTPMVFDEIDIYLNPKREVQLYVEVVASVRIPNNARPFVLKESRLAEGYATLIEYNGDECVLIDEQNLTIGLTRGMKVPPEGQEAYIIMDISQKEPECSKLPIDFICPTEAIQAYNMIYQKMKEVFDPLTSSFQFYSPLIFDFLMFWEMSKNDRIMQCIVEDWDHSTIESLIHQIRKYYMCTSLVFPTGPYPIYSIPETQDKMITHCSMQIQRSKNFVEERFKPFHTDEFRKSLIMYNNADW